MSDEKELSYNISEGMVECFLYNAYCNGNKFIKATDKLESILGTVESMEITVNHLIGDADYNLDEHTRELSERMLVQLEDIKLAIGTFHRFHLMNMLVPKYQFRAILK